MSNCVDFYRDRDQRTYQVLGASIPAVPVRVRISEEAARTRAGQHLALALVNMLARVHRTITIDSPAVPLLVKPLIPTEHLDKALLLLAATIDPCGAFSSSPTADATTLGIGAVEANYYVGADGAIALLDHVPQPIRDEGSALLGAGLAACLGAAAVLSTTLGTPVRRHRVSAWNYREDEQADPGPPVLQKADMGTVLMVGAGAVAAALAYWAVVLGIDGIWTVVDRDVVKLHNTNRGMLFFPAHAGWRAGDVWAKADVIAQYLPNATPVTTWYDEAKAVQEGRYDVVLPLANERNVRTWLAHRNDPVQLYATTGNWFSQLHRHISGVDDCIDCRMVDVPTGTFQCSTSPVITDEGSTDAALPFLSSASGLLLASSLLRLAHGSLATERLNDFRFDFASQHRFASWGRRRCREACKIPWPAEVRRSANQNTRWASLSG